MRPTLRESGVRESSSVVLVIALTPGDPVRPSMGKGTYFSTLLKNAASFASHNLTDVLEHVCSVDDGAGGPRRLPLRLNVDGGSLLMHLLSVPGITAAELAAIILRRCVPLLDQIRAIAAGSSVNVVLDGPVRPKTRHEDATHSSLARQQVVRLAMLRILRAAVADVPGLSAVMSFHMGVSDAESTAMILTSIDSRAGNVRTVTLTADGDALAFPGWHVRMPVNSGSADQRFFAVSQAHFIAALRTDLSKRAAGAHVGEVDSDLLPFMFFLARGDYTPVDAGSSDLQAAMCTAVAAGTLPGMSARLQSVIRDPAAGADLPALIEDVLRAGSSAGVIPQPVAELRIAAFRRVEPQRLLMMLRLSGADQPVIPPGTADAAASVGVVSGLPALSDEVRALYSALVAEPPPSPWTGPPLAPEGAPATYSPLVRALHKLVQRRAALSAAVPADDLAVDRATSLQSRLLRAGLEARSDDMGSDAIASIRIVLDDGDDEAADVAGSALGEVKISCSAANKPAIDASLRAELATVQVEQWTGELEYLSCELEDVGSGDSRWRRAMSLAARLARSNQWRMADGRIGPHPPRTDRQWVVVDGQFVTVHVAPETGERAAVSAALAEWQSRYAAALTREAAEVAEQARTTRGRAYAGLLPARDPAWEPAVRHFMYAARDAAPAPAAGESSVRLCYWSRHSLTAACTAAGPQIDAVQAVVTEWYQLYDLAEEAAAAWTHEQVEAIRLDADSGSLDYNNTAAWNSLVRHDMYACRATTTLAADSAAGSHWRIVSFTAAGQPGAHCNVCTAEDEASVAAVAARWASAFRDAKAKQRERQVGQELHAHVVAGSLHRCSTRWREYVRWRWEELRRSIPRTPPFEKTVNFARNGMTVGMVAFSEAQVTAAKALREEVYGFFDTPDVSAEARAAEEAESAALQCLVTAIESHTVPRADLKRWEAYAHHRLYSARDSAPAAIISGRGAPSSWTHLNLAIRTSSAAQLDAVRAAAAAVDEHWDATPEPPTVDMLRSAGMVVATSRRAVGSERGKGAAGVAVSEAQSPSVGSKRRHPVPASSLDKASPGAGDDTEDGR